MVRMPAESGAPAIGGRDAGGRSLQRRRRGHRAQAVLRWCGAGAILAGIGLGGAATAVADPIQGCAQSHSHRPCNPNHPQCPHGVPASGPPCGTRPTAPQTAPPLVTPVVPEPTTTEPTTPTTTEPTTPTTTEPTTPTTTEPTTPTTSAGGGLVPLPVPLPVPVPIPVPPLQGSGPTLSGNNLVLPPPMSVPPGELVRAPVPAPPGELVPAPVPAPPGELVPAPVPVPPGETAIPAPVPDVAADAITPGSADVRPDVSSLDETRSPQPGYETTAAQSGLGEWGSALVSLGGLSTVAAVSAVFSARGARAQRARANATYAEFFGPTARRGL
jgi:hypothetical protein